MIIIKTQKEIDVMREGGHELARIVDELGKMARPGVSTHEIDERARALIFDFGGIPIFEGYGDPANPYPGAVCASINSEIVHGIPRKDRILKEGDILKIDIGMKYKDLITDMARTFPVGYISERAKKIISVTKKSLDLGIASIVAGKKMSEYSRTVERFVEAKGYSIIKELVGHGVGRYLHEEPQIPNYVTRGKDVVWREGMTIALEPMVNEGTHNIKLEEDGWTYVTMDGLLSAHFEDTIVITKGGVEILTRV